MKYVPVILFIIFVSFQLNKELIIIPGEKLGSVKINNSRSKDVISEFGENYTLLKGHACGEVSFSFYSLTYAEGLVFSYSSLNKRKIDRIIIWAPIKARTIEGIILGKSTKEDVLKTYGIPDKVENIEGLEKIEYIEKGITFYLSTISVARIEIYKKKRIKH